MLNDRWRAYQVLKKCDMYNRFETIVTQELNSDYADIG